MVGPVAEPCKFVSYLCELRRSPFCVGFGFEIRVHVVERGQLLCVGAVKPGSPADKAGLKVDDIITDVNGANVLLEPPSITRQKITGSAFTLALLVKRKKNTNYDTCRRIISGFDVEMQSIADHRKQNPTGTNQDANIRMYHLKKRNDFNGYGFHIQQRMLKPGYFKTFVTYVEEWSPAQVADLKVGYQIIKINDLDIEQCKEDLIYSMVYQTKDMVTLQVRSSEDTTQWIQAEIGKAIPKDTTATPNNQKEISSGQQSERATYTDMLSASIFLSLFCGVIFGLVSLYYVIKARRSSKKGQIKDAEYSIRIAMVLMVIGLLISIVAIFVVVFKVALA